MTTLGELKRMLEGSDKADASFPDLPAIMGRGRRLRRRRRAGVAVVAAACSLAIAVPVGIRAGTEDGRGSEAPVAPTPDRDSQQPDAKEQPSLPRRPGYSCEPLRVTKCEATSPGRPLGPVVDTGVRIDGGPILLWAELSEHYYDYDTLVPTMTLGVRAPATGGLKAYEWVWWEQPGRVPPELTLFMIVYRDGRWLVAGAVNDPAVAAAVAVEPDGSPVEAVRLSEREVAPGMRAFWAWGENYSDPNLPGVEFRLLDADGDVLHSCVVGGRGPSYRVGCPAFFA